MTPKPSAKMDIEASEDYDYFPVSGNPAETAIKDGFKGAKQSQVFPHAETPGAGNVQSASSTGEKSSRAASSPTNGFVPESDLINVPQSSSPEIDGQRLPAKRVSDGASDSSRYSDFSQSISIGDGSEYSSRRTSSMTHSVPGASNGLSRQNSSALDSPGAAAIKVFEVSSGPSDAAPITVEPADGAPKEVERAGSHSLASLGKVSSRNSASSVLERTQSRSSASSTGWAESTGRMASLDTEEIANPGDMLRLLSSFVPKLLLQAAASEPEAFSSQATVNSFTAAIMIADVTGFTPLTERALTSKRGTELVEELTVCMNNYFNEAIDMVFDYGGDIIKFAGDSLIVAFPVNRAAKETPEACTLRAAACGFDLVSTLGAYTPQLGGYGDTDHSSHEDMSSTIGAFRPAATLNKADQAMKVLVVDDIVLNRVVLSKMLTKLGCEVVHANNGKEAVEAFSKNDFPLVFMDLLMPVMDGYEATREIRKLENPQARPTFISAVTAQLEDQAKKGCLDAGMDGFLMKPITMAQLVTIVKSKATRQTRGLNLGKTFPLPKAMSVNKSRDTTATGGPEIAAPLTLSLKVMVGVGEVRILNVGGEPQLKSGIPRWEYFMADPPQDPAAPDVVLRQPMDQVKGCDHFATSGNVILSPEVWALIGKECDGEVLENGFIRLNRVLGRIVIPEQKKILEFNQPDVAAAIVRGLRTYIPDSVYTRLLHNQASSSTTALAEIRRCTCLFLGLPSLSDPGPLGGPPQLTRIQAVLTTVQQCLAATDGCLLQMRMDEKGYLMIAAFGLPGNTHQDDPMRGVKTALTIRDKLKAIGEMGVAGVTTGKLLCATVGGRRRCEYTVYGDSINLSARLMKKATDEVLIDSATYDATNTAIEYVALPPMSVKGKKQPLAVYRPVGLKGRDGKKGHALTQNLSSVGAESLSQLLLVGRKEELTLLLSKVSRLKTLQKRDRGSSSGRKVRRSTIQDESGGTVADYESLISASPKEDPGQSFRAKNKVALAALKSPSMESARDGALRPTPRSQSFAQPGSAAARALTSAATSAGVVLILGQAGIGKSSLISMMRAQIEAQNPEVQVVMTSGGSGGLGQQVLGPWIRLVLSRLELPPEFSPEQRGQAVVKHLPNLLQSQAYVLNDALKMSAPQSVTPNSPSRAGTNFGANESPSVSFAPTPQHNALPTLNLLGRVPLSADEPPTPLAPLEEDPTDEQRPRGKRRFSRKASLKRRGRGLGLLESELQNLRGPLRRMSMPGGGESPDPESIAPGGLPPLPGTVVETPERERHSSDAGTPNEHPRRGNRFVTMALGGYDHTEIAPPRVDGSAGSTPDAWEDSPLPGRRGTRFMTHAGGASPGLKEGGRLAQGQTKREVPGPDGHVIRVERLLKLTPVQEVPSAEMRAQMMCTLLKHLVLALIKAPCVLVVEDAHAMDEPSWSVLKAISEEPASGVLCVLASRPLAPDARGARDYQAVVASPGTTQIFLREMSASDTRAVICKRVCPTEQPRGIPESVFEAIYSKTHGHPLFVEQMTGAMLEKGIIHVAADGACHVSKEFDLDTYSFSYSVEALITSRVDLLAPLQANVLKLASVIGMDFDADLLLAVVTSHLVRDGLTPITREQLLRTLDDLDHLNFLNVRKAENGKTYHFSNSVTMEVTASTLPSKMRRTIHLDVAQELVAREAELDSLCVSIAHHYTQACKDVEDLECDITDNAVFYWERAARDALFKFGQYRTAIRYYEEALHLSNTMGQMDRVDQTQRGTWHRHIAYAHAALGELDPSMEHLKRSLQEIGVHVPAAWPRVASFRARRFRVWRFCGCRGGGLKHIVPRKFLESQKSMKNVSEARKNTMENVTSLAGMQLLKSHVFYQLGSLAASSNDLPVAMYASKQALACVLTSESALKVDVARAHSLCAVLAAAPDEVETSMSQCMVVLDGCQSEMETPRVQAAEIFYNIALTALYHGQWIQADNYACDAADVFELCQGQREVDLCNCCRAMVFLYQGKSSFCFQEGTRMIEARRDHPELHLWGSCLAAAAAAALGKYDEVWRVYEEMEETYDGQSHKEKVADYLSLQAKAFACEALLRQGARARAIEQAVALLPRFASGTPLCPLAAAATCAIMEVLLDSLEELPRGVARTAREDQIALLTKHFNFVCRRMIFARVYQKYFEARLTLAAGKHKRARDQFRETVTQAANMSMWTLHSTADTWLHRC